MNQEPATPITGASGSATRPGGDGVPSGSPGAEADAGVAALLETATAWIEENQTVAMLGAFAVGVFIGVMIRR